MSSGTKVAVQPSSSGPFEKLPPEIRLMILEQIPNLPTLQALINASPGYHAIYIQNRANILFCVLQNDMSPEVFLDALYLQSAIEEIWNCGCLSRMMGVTISIQNLPQAGLRLPNCDGQVTWGHYLMTARYCHYSLSLHPLSWVHLPEYAKLSKTETNRIYRAMYRFEIYCGLLQYMHYSNNLLEQRNAAQFSRMISRGSLAWIFCRHFTAWEVEEMICIRDYICHYYAFLLEELTPLINRHRGADKIWSSRYHVDAYRALASAGLGSTNEVMKTMARRVEHYGYPGYIIAKDLHETIHSVQWNEGHSFQIDFAAHKPQLSVVFFGRRGAVNYECPEASKLEVQYEGEHQGPSKGWTWATGSKYHAPADTIDRALDWRNNPLTSWGYVLWDSDWLEKWGLLDSDPETFVAPNEKAGYAWDSVDQVEEMNRHVRALENMDLMDLVRRTS